MKTSSLSRYAVFGLCFATLAYGSGGWVGNSPLIAMLSPTVYKRPASPLPTSVYDASDSDDAATEGEASSDRATTPIPEETYNSLFVKQGQHRLLYGFSILRGKILDEEMMLWSPGLGYAYGINEKWVYMAPTYFGYSLRATNGDGQEWGLVFSPIGIPTYGSRTGWTISPSVAVVHTYGTGPWRFTHALTTTAAYRFGNTDRGAGVEGFHLGLQLNAQYRLSDRWSLGVGTGVGGGFQDVERERCQTDPSRSPGEFPFCESRVERRRASYASYFLNDLSLSATAAIFQSSQVSFTVQRLQSAYGGGVTFQTDF